MTQWDYLRVDVIYGELGTYACYVDGEPAEFPINEGALVHKHDRDRLFYDLGSRGWEMIGVAAWSGRWEYLFKRARKAK